MPEKSPSLANNGEVVDIALASLNGALRHICWPISPPTPKLSNPMPMDGDIILDMVNHFNEKTVTLPCYNAWPRKLPIYCQNALCMAQSRHILQFDIKLVVPGYARILGKGKLRKEA